MWYLSLLSCNTQCYTHTHIHTLCHYAVLNLASHWALITFLIHLVHDEANPTVCKFGFGLMRASSMVYHHCLWCSHSSYVWALPFPLNGIVLVIFFYAFFYFFSSIFYFFSLLYFEILSGSARLHWFLFFTSISEVIWVWIMVHVCLVLDECIFLPFFFFFVSYFVLSLIQTNWWHALCYGSKISFLIYKNKIIFF